MQFHGVAVHVFGSPADAVGHGFVSVGPLSLPVVPGEVGAVEAAVIVEDLGALAVSLILIGYSREEGLCQQAVGLDRFSTLYFGGGAGHRIGFLGNSDALDHTVAGNDDVCEALLGFGVLPAGIVDTDNCIGSATAFLIEGDPIIVRSNGPVYVALEGDGAGTSFQADVDFQAAGNLDLSCCRLRLRLRLRIGGGVFLISAEGNQRKNQKQGYEFLQHG